MDNMTADLKATKMVEKKEQMAKNWAEMRDWQRGS